MHTWDNVAEKYSKWVFENVCASLGLNFFAILNLDSFKYEKNANSTPNLTKILAPVKNKYILIGNWIEKVEFSLLAKGRTTTRNQ